MAQKAVDQAVSDIVHKVVEFPATETEKARLHQEAASIVKEQNTKTMKAEMIKNVQQLRLRQPNMVKKEYQALVQKVKTRGEVGDIQI